MIKESPIDVEKTLATNPINNSDIWVYILSQRNHIPEEEMSILLEVYQDSKHALPKDNFPVAELLKLSLLKGSSISKLRKDSFLQKVAFDYQPAIHRTQVYEQDVERLKRGEIRFMDLEKPKYWSLERWLESDLSYLSRTGYAYHNKDKNSVWEITHYGKDYYNYLLLPTIKRLIPHLETDQILLASRWRTAFHATTQPQILSII